MHSGASRSERVEESDDVLVGPVRGKMFPLYHRAQEGFLALPRYGRIRVVPKGEDSGPFSADFARYLRGKDDENENPEK